MILNASSAFLEIRFGGDLARGIDALSEVRIAPKPFSPAIKVPGIKLPKLAIPAIDVSAITAAAQHSLEER